MNSRKLLSEAQRTFPATNVRCQQPSRILVVDVTSPSWTNTCSVLAEALENALCLACSLTGPCRVPLLSLYVVQNQQECLLPFTQVKENFARIQACISELRSLPREGCFPQWGNGVVQAVQDGLQQFKQYSRHTATGGSTNSSVEITILTSQSSKEMVKQLEKKLKDVDLVSLRRIQVIEVLKRDFLEPEEVEQCLPAEEPSSSDIAILGMDIDVQTIEDNVISLEMLFKTWLHDYGTEREHLHLLLPSGGFSHAAAPKTTLMCLKCDLQERLLDPALLSGMVDGTVRAADLNSPCQMAAWPATVLYKLRVVKALKSEGVCESILYGLPFIIKPTSCWRLDWDELEINQHSFHALCHSLLKRKWMLLAKREPQNTSPNWNIMVHSYYVIVPSDSATLLVKAVAIRELLLPSTFPALLAEHPERVRGAVESALNSLEVEVAYNPLHLKSNLYKYLKSMLYKPLHRQQAQPRDPRPERHQPKQVCLLPLMSLDSLCSALLVCFLQKGWGQRPDTRRYREGSVWQGQHAPAAGRAEARARHKRVQLRSGVLRSWHCRQRAVGQASASLHKARSCFVPVLQHQGRAKATVAPLLMAPSPVQVLRPAAMRRDSCERSPLPKEYDEFLQ